MNVTLIAVAAAAAIATGAVVWATVAGHAPQWVGAMVYRCRGKRLVRVHIERMIEAQEGVIGETDATIEGILVGRWDGMYVLTRASQLGSDESVSLVGDVEIPANRVIFMQMMGRGR